MQTHVLLLSKAFFKNHPKAGKPTDFKQKLSLNQKIHTVRLNYAYWVYKIKEVMAGRAILSIRQWSGNPYNSIQIELKQLTAADNIGIQPIFINFNHEWPIRVNNRKLNKSERIYLAANDGLSLLDFKNWFGCDDYQEPMALIHFTGFRY